MVLNPTIWYNLKSTFLFRNKSSSNTKRKCFAWRCDLVGSFKRNAVTGPGSLAVPEINAEKQSGKGKGVPETDPFEVVAALREREEGD